MHLWLCWCYIIITFKGGKEENEGNRKTKSHNKIQKDHCNTSYIEYGIQYYN